MNHSVGNLMTPMPCTLPVSVSVTVAATAMREHDIGSIIVTDDDEHLFGILTDRDIVVRVLAEDMDPVETLIADVCSRELTTVRLSDSVESAVRLMRAKAPRRLPVVADNGDVVGIVSLGDLAVERDRE